MHTYIYTHTHAHTHTHTPVTHSASAWADGARSLKDRSAQTTSNSNLTLDWTRMLTMEEKGIRRST